MTDQGKTVLDLPVKTSIDEDDRLVFIYSPDSANAQTATITVANYETHTIQPDPANSNALVIDQGQLFFSNNFGYFSTANNHVKRFTLSDF